MATVSATSTTATVTLPPSLMFLVSNFHSLVNIKLDASNYLLWRVQIESVMEANGFYGYLDGSIEPPPTQIRDSQGELVLNPAYSLWRLIDSQLKSCLTASLSQITLPYVLGLQSSHQIWVSLSNRYNLLTETHVQELKDQLYSLSKTSSIDSYIDKIKELAQKLAAAGSPLEDDELVFRTLHGLPKAFNGLRTAVRAIRTRGHSISFDELITMLKSEDVQLIHESASDVEVQNSTVLVATHGHQNSFPTNRKPESSQFSQQSSILCGPSSQLGIQSPGYYDQTSQSSQFVVPFSSSQQHGNTNSFSYPSQLLPSQFGVSSQYGSPFLVPSFGSCNPFSSLPTSPQFMSPQFGVQQFGPPQFGSQQFRGFSRGRGRGPRMPCEICGRNNHSTNYCYYRPPQMS